MAYFTYDTRFGGEGTMLLIGGSKAEIVATLDHYRGRGMDFSGNLETGLTERTEFFVECFDGISDPAHCIDIKVGGGKSLVRVNATAFNRIRSVVMNRQGYRRGDLYKIHTGNPVSPLVYLPEDVMEELARYNWEGDREKVKGWLSNLEARDEILESRKMMKKPAKKGMN